MSNQNHYYPASVQPGIPHLFETPKGWKKEPLGKYLIEIKRPAEMVDNKEYQLVTVKRSRGGVEERAKLLGKKIKVKSQFYVQTGDFLISKRQIVHGACGLVPDELNGALVSGEYAVLGTNGGISLAYLKYLSESVYFQQTCFQSSIGVHVEKMVFKIDRWLKWDFNIPSFPEQQKIADILTTADDKISSIDRRIQQTEQLKKGLMEKLLTEGIGHTEFKETEIGRIPVDWSFVKLGDMGETYNGLTGKTKDDFGKGLPYIPYTNIFSFSKINLELIDYVEIVEGEQQNTIEYGDIIFTTSSETPHEVGMSSVLLDKMTDKIYLNSFCFGFRMYDFNWLLPSYARFLFRGEKVRKSISVLAQGSTRFNLSKKALLSKLYLPLPTLPEQKQIATILSTVDDKLDILTQKKSQYQTLKKGLSQQLLTGQMRVKV